MKSWALALATATLAWGCVAPTPPGATADAQRDALVQRARIYKADAEKAPASLSPQRKSELQQLANDVRAWQARTGRNDIRVTDKRATTARRASEGGTGNCDMDCPVYTFEHDQICFLKGSECSSDPESYGTICIYNCISIASNLAPERSQGL
jgi:hypothetical protein